MSSLARIGALLPLLLKTVDVAAAAHTPPAGTCLRFGAASACHDASDGSFTITRKTRQALPAFPVSSSYQNDHSLWRRSSSGPR